MNQPLRSPVVFTGVLALLQIAIANGCSNSKPQQRGVNVSEGVVLADVRRLCDEDPDAVQRCLLDPAYRELRDHEEFRKAIYDAAIKHKTTSLILVGADEPGEWIEIDGTVVDAEDKPIADAVVRVFATDEQGRYHPIIEGETLPRIFGTLVSNDLGRFRFRTVRPGPYPGTRNARHIHISARSGNLRLDAPHYAVFDDDPLLYEPQNAEPRGEAIRIAMQPPSADGVTRGTIRLPMR